jgi:hypothetical protein
MRPIRVFLIGLAMAVVLVSGLVSGSLLGSSSTAGASASGSSSCAGALQPVGGDSSPSGSFPVPDSSTMADWSGQSIPISATGDVKWQSSTQQITGVPNSIVEVTKIVGGQLVTAAPILFKPLELGPGTSPGTELVALTASFNVTCMSGSPSLLIWEARFESSGPIPNSPNP